MYSQMDLLSFQESRSSAKFAEERRTSVLGASDQKRFILSLA